MWGWIILILCVLVLIMFVGTSESAVSSLRGSPQIRWSGFRDIIYQVRPVIIDAGPTNPATQGHA